MNPEIKTKWLAALRSDDYAQAKGKLRQYGRKKFCCLGVLADINGEAWKAHDKRYWTTAGGDRGMYCDHGTGLGYDDAMGLIDLNDSGRTFLEIADHVEANL